MKKLILIILVFILPLLTFAQKASISVSYTTTYDWLSVLPDSINVANLTQGGDTTLYGADTTLILDYTTGLNDNQPGSHAFVLMPNYPNPFINQTFFSVFIPEYGQLSIQVFDIVGRNVISLTEIYSKGIQKFSFRAATDGLYILNATYNNHTSSIKVSKSGGLSNSRNKIEYLGIESLVIPIKSSDAKGGFSFTFGDLLNSVVYYQSISDTNIFIPTKDTVIKVNFITCPPSFTDIRDGNVYSAVQIGSQCWMAENLAYLPLVSPSSAGSETTPYYYVYDYQGTDVNAAKATSNYQTYGVLYNWPAAMDGDASSNSVPSGVQGICPSGWHLPSDEELKILEGTVDSQYGYPDPEWDGTGWRGTDVGGNLKETGTTHWNLPNTGATNSSSFTALPGGYRHGGSFYGLGNYANFWSSAEDGSSHAWYRYLYYSNANVGRDGNLKLNGFSVRCTKD